jgi:hypothetical protein
VPQDMITKPTNARKYMKVHYTTVYLLHVSATHVATFREWPKHAGGIRSVYYTFIHLCAFVGFAIKSNCLINVMDHLKLICVSHREVGLLPFQSCCVSKGKISDI